MACAAVPSKRLRLQRQREREREREREKEREKKRNEFALSVRSFVRAFTTETIREMMIIHGRQHDENVKCHYAITVLRAPINVSVKRRLIQVLRFFHIY